MTFEIRRGEFVLLGGASGCGKSTLGLCFMGIRPGMLPGRTEGSLLVEGRSSLERQTHAIAKDMGMVLQSPDDQISNLIVEDEIVFGLENNCYPPTEIDVRLKEALEVGELEHLNRRPVWELSGGEKQRVALASMVALRPPILWLDEPTSNLDPRGEREVWATIQRLRERYGTTVVLVQHNVDAVLPKIDRVILMDGGVVFDGRPHQLVKEFGWRVRDELGLWLPQATEVAFRLKDRGWSIPNIPLGDDVRGEEALRAAYLDRLATSGGGHLDGPSRETDTDEVQSIEAPVEEDAPVGISWLRVQQVSYTHPGSSVQALSGVTLGVSKGEMVALVGPNGAGKSTLTMMMVGLINASTGAITVDGTNTTSLGPERLGSRVAYVFQNPDHQFIADTVEDEVAHGPRALGWAPTEVQQRTEEILGRLGLLDARSRHPFTLSMGQRRRLSVGCMLAPRPEAIILDEPTFGQDWRSASELMALMKSLNVEGTTIILVTHDMRLVAEYARRVFVLVDGRLIFDGTPAALFDAPEILSAASLDRPPVANLARTLIGEVALTPAELVVKMDR
jgi:energy-coupling factor transport system ATP-binding protein